MFSKSDGIQMEVRSILSWPFNAIPSIHSVAKCGKVKCRIRTSVNCYRDTSEPQVEFDKFNPVVVYQLFVTELSGRPPFVPDPSPCQRRKHIFHSPFFSGNSFPLFSTVTEVSIAKARNFLPRTKGLPTGYLCLRVCFSPRFCASFYLSLSFYCTPQELHVQQCQIVLAV